MNKSILQQIADKGIKSRILPIEILKNLKSDILHFSETESLNGFQKWIVNERYILDVPELSFEPKSILVAAVKFKPINIIFNFEGKKVSDMFCTAEKGVKNYINTLFSQNGYNSEYVHWLPQKRIAVCSGLAEYGRNNITYIDGWGSFFELQTYMSDMPCEQSYTWRNVCCMDICINCEACLKNCPTNAIRDNRFLIDNEICLSRLTELQSPFPDWLPMSVHHSVYGCYRCQDVCPKDISIFKSTIDTEVFEEEETRLLLNGIKRKDMPEKLLDKVEKLGIEDWRLLCLPKNLKALLDNIT